ncbi:sperm-associated antigen 1 [Protobothrops mucrosquamatus]|uniref:sperm-associated antigen 1 n=1 Tax=Protobothrops mucrosquamatus TaxID=103944 RepID=UPI0007756C72|nr:sperm-associated antigen 1 [Protobothrops mucrosquamatus]XP_029139462.1 sperm-associated antigen 1 [Protobothrops mucrosquamatus]
MSSWLGHERTKTYKIPIDHLDYKFIEKCTDVKYLEKILKILRSGEEGFFPQLNSFCENRIETLAPNSRILRKEKHVANASDFTTEEWKKINDDLTSWITEMKEDEYKTQYATTEVVKENVENLPPIRSSENHLSLSQNKTAKTKQKKKNVPRDYREWDKFDVEKECSKTEDQEDNYSKTSINNNIKLPKAEIDTIGMTTKEKTFAAHREKEKGNEAFVIGDYKEAIAYYSRSISALPTVAAYNNRAQTEIKLQDWQNAVRDCEAVLKMEPENTKALIRRSTVYNKLQNFKAAAEDLRKVLHIDPKNAIAKKKLSDIDKNLKESEPVSQTQSKGKRIFIEEIEESEEQERNEGEFVNGAGKRKTAVLVGRESTSKPAEMGNVQKKFSSRGGAWKPDHKEAQKPRDPSENNTKKGTSEETIRESLQGGKKEINGYLSNCLNGNETGEGKPKDVESSTAGISRSTLLPDNAAKLKTEGNELFKNGQFGEAMLKYSRAIESVLSSGIQTPEDLSILYSNRAACYLKEGNCADCIQDCNSALELHPYSIKPLLRRAMAYESMERYQQAYVDYKTLLQIDSGIQVANDSVNRITRTLIDLDGPNWREKLPPIPVVPVSDQLHWWDGESFTSELKQKKTANICRNQLSQIPSDNAEEKFKLFKNQGNEFVKKGKYEEALMKYDECIKLNSQEKTIYTNRALCFLKLLKYEEAKKDCDYVLQIDGSNIKALYRRALAYKGLENYEASIEDLNKVLLIDSGIGEAQKELEETTQLFKLKREFTANDQPKQRKKIEIQEANEPEEDDTETCSSKNTAIHPCSAKEELESTMPLNSSEKLIISKPSNAYEFGQIMNIVNANKDIAACAELLAMIEPKDLPVLLSNKLEGDIFLIFIQALQSDVFSQNPNLVYQHLFYLSKAERFKVAQTLLGKNEIEQVQQLLASLFNAQDQQFSLNDLENLKKSFEL